jgi:hypothetical protein
MSKSLYSFLAAVNNSTAIFSGLFENIFEKMDRSTKDFFSFGNRQTQFDGKIPFSRSTTEKYRVPVFSFLHSAFRADFFLINNLYFDIAPTQVIILDS